MTWSQLKALLNTAKVLHDGRGGFAFSSVRVSAKQAGK
mgnify:CR=1 FL=1|jgi:hypothetical protein